MNLSMVNAAAPAEVRRSLWRAHAVFRSAALVFALYVILRFRDADARPGLALVVAAALVGWTALTVVAALRGWLERADWLVADVVVVAGLTLTSLAVQFARQLDGSTPTLTSLWAAAPCLAVGIRAGWRAGLAAALVQGGASIAVRDGYDERTLTNLVLLILAGGLVGYVSSLVVRAQVELGEVSEARAALRERERLARGIHDGVLQILALVQRRGAELGGPAAQLGRLAGEQESALRGLITSKDHDRRGAPPPSEVDVAARLAALRTSTRTVAVPAGPVLLPSRTGEELLGAVGAALSNVERHAGSSARTWILCEDLGDEVGVTVRDDGAGFARDRLAQAARDGRLGVASSIRGRLVDLGGTVEITSALGEGTEVDLVVPRSGSPARTRAPGGA